MGRKAISPNGEPLERYSVKLSTDVIDYAKAQANQSRWVNDTLRAQMELEQKVRRIMRRKR